MARVYIHVHGQRLYTCSWPEFIYRFMARVYIQVHGQSLYTGSWPEFIYMFMARDYIHVHGRSFSKGFEKVEQKLINFTYYPLRCIWPGFFKEGFDKLIMRHDLATGGTNSDINSHRSMDIPNFNSQNSTKILTLCLSVIKK
jgi:hypothetical protein